MLLTNRIYGFPPIVFDDSRVLILGTLPGRESLLKGYYYADNSNYFWKFFCNLTGKDKPQNMAEAGSVLKAARVAVWDMYESGIRVEKDGSSTSKDSAIKEPVWNDIEEFLKTHPQIEKIGITGGKNYEIFKRKYPSISAEKISSTSGANGVFWGNDTSKPGWTEWRSFVNQ